MPAPWQLLATGALVVPSTALTACSRSCLLEWQELVPADRRRRAGRHRGLRPGPWLISNSNLGSWTLQPGPVPHSGWRAPAQCVSPVGHLLPRCTATWPPVPCPLGLWRVACVPTPRLQAPSLGLCACCIPLGAGLRRCTPRVQASKSKCDQGCPVGEAGW